MIISVIIPTYNRSKSLLETLESLDAQQVNEDLSWEIVIVDNNSTDDTERIVHDFAQRSKVPCRYLFEARQGRPFALNRGIEETDSELLAFTDDDVIADPYWVQSIVSTFYEHDADFVGGKILPKWLECSPPAWFTRDWWGNLSLLDHGDQLINIKQKGGYGLWGANQAVNRKTLQRCGMFDNRFIFSQDYEFYKRLIIQGAKVIYQPKAVIYHKIEKNRVRMTYFYRWHYRRGKIEGFTNDNSYEGKSLIGGIPNWMVRKQLEQGLAWLSAILSFDSNAIFVQGVWFWRHYGKLIGIAKAHREYR